MSYKAEYILKCLQLQTNNKHNLKLNGGGGGSSSSSIAAAAPLTT
jgi:hypothetical protein